MSDLRTGLIPTYLGEPMIPAPRSELPPLPRRRSWRTRVREEGVVVGVITAACIAPAYAIAQILLGGAQ